MAGIEDYYFKLTEDKMNKLNEIEEGNMNNLNKLTEVEMGNTNDFKEEDLKESPYMISMPDESLPYNWHIDPGVPAPLRRIWKNIDESIREQYWGMKRCYLEFGEFDLSVFISLSEENDEKTKKEFSDLAKENKEIAMRELERCYEKNGEFGNIKFHALLEEEKKHLNERIKETKEQLQTLRKRLKENDESECDVSMRLGHQDHQTKYRDYLEY